MHQLGILSLKQAHIDIFIEEAFNPVPDKSL